MIPAAKIEPEVLRVLHRLSIPPSLADAVIAEVQRRIAIPTKPRTVDVVRVREQIRRLKLSWRAGDEDLDEQTYFSELRRLEGTLAEEPSVSARRLDLDKAMSVLRDMPSLLEVASKDQQRALIQQVLRQVWVERAPKRHGDAWVKAIAPTSTYEALVGAIVSSSNFAVATSTGLEPATFSSGG
jgi:hypothetical protein